MTKPSLVFLLALAPLVDVGAQSSSRVRPLIEELRIHGQDHDWKQVGTVRVGPSGHILVGENRGTSIRVFSPTGQLVRSLGGRGQGPGEFEGVATFGVLGDSIWAGDRSLVRLTFFDLSGKVLGTLRTDSALRPVQSGASAQMRMLTWNPPFVLYRDGTALVAPLTLSSDADTLGNIAVYPYWRTTWRGQVLDTVLTFLRVNPAVRIAYPDGSRRTILSNPFPPRQQADAALNGLRLAVVDASFSGPDAWSYAVRLMDERGRQLYARRFPFTRVPVPKHTVDSLVDVMTKRFQGYAGIREAIPVPPSYPPVTRLLVANDGSVWLRGRDDPAGATWTVLDPKGDLTATVREPARTRFVEIDGGVWAIERDEGDVESIVRYRVGPG